MIRLVQKKRNVLLSTSLAWPAVAGYTGFKMSSEVKCHLALHMALFTISYLRTFSEMLELPFSQRRRKAVLRGTVQLRQRQGLQQWRRRRRRRQRRRRQPLRAQQGLCRLPFLRGHAEAMQQPQGVRPPGGVHRDAGEGVQRPLSRVVE